MNRRYKVRCKVLVISLASAVGLLCPTAGAEETAATTDLFEETARSITANSPILKAYMLEAESELESLRAENELEAPEIGGSYLWGRGETGNKWSVSLSQSFDWPGAYKARRRAVGKGEDAMEALRLSNYCDKLLEVRQALVGLIGARKMVALCREVKDNLDRLGSLISEGYRRGETTRLDINKIKIESIGAENRLNDALTAEEGYIAALTALNGGIEPELGAIDEYPLTPLKPLEEYKRAATERNPQKRYLRASLEQAEARAKAERLGRLPGFSVGIEHENEMGEKFNGVSLSISLPFLTRRHSLRGARLAASALELREQAVREDDLWRTEADYRRAKRIGEQLAKYGPAVNSVDNTGLLKKAYEGGEISLVEYLRELAYFTDAQRDYLQLEQGYWETMMSLGRY